MEKVDLTLDSIIGGDFNKWLLPQHVRDYLVLQDSVIFDRAPKYWYISSPRSLLYLMLFEESYESYHYLCDEDRCHRCGIALHILNQIFHLCNWCDNATAENVNAKDIL